MWSGARYKHDAVIVVVGFYRLLNSTSRILWARLRSRRAGNAILAEHPALRNSGVLAGAFPARNVCLPEASETAEHTDASIERLDK